MVQCRVPPLHKEEPSDAAEACSEEEDDDSPSSNPTLPVTSAQPALQHAAPSAASKKLKGAGPSMAFQRLNLQRSAPSGSFSKEFQLRVRSLVQE